MFDVSAFLFAAWADRAKARPMNGIGKSRSGKLSGIEPDGAARPAAILEISIKCYKVIFRLNIDFDLATLPIKFSAK